MRRIILSAALLFPFCAHAQAPTPKPDPVQLALGRMLAEAQQREANALIELNVMRAERDAAVTRADAVEKKPEVPVKP